MWNLKTNTNECIYKTERQQTYSYQRGGGGINYEYGGNRHTLLYIKHANTINHYLCDTYPLLQLSWTSTYILELEVIIVSGINIILPSLTIFVSYGLILSNILHISSTEGRSKAFRTCSSHIIAVSLFFGSSAFVYLKPSSMPMNKGKVLSVFYTNVIPMMNPLIYSLRNKDVKLALRKVLRMVKFWSETLSVCAYSFRRRRFCVFI